jgi:hypothetical protein
VATHRTAKTPIEDTLDCPLVELGLVRESTKGSYVLVRGDHPTLSDGLFAYALADYLRTIESVASTIPLESVAFRPGAPGRVFSLTEEALLQRLERIDETTDGQLAYDETAGLRQVFLHRLPPPEALLEKCFATAAIDGRAA